MRIFHIALRSEWEAARQAGSYSTSTLGRTLAEEGFIHASRGDQWQGVRDAFYADVDEPLVLLVIDTHRLTSPVVEEVPVGGGDEKFPHIYGPINASAVIRAVPLDDHGEGPPQSFSAVFLGELFRNLLLASILFGLIAFSAILGNEVAGDWGALVGAGLAVLVGVPLVVLAHRKVSR